MPPTPTSPQIELQGSGYRVYPTGSYPTDLDNVTWAVAHVTPGGTVLLKTTDLAGARRYFHFGDDATGRGSVNVEVDAVITGEPGAPLEGVFPNNKAPKDSFVPARTTIYGGKRPFRCRETNASATTLTVRNLYFAYPSLAAVQVKKTAGLEVSDCIVYDVAGAMADALGFEVAVGIEATGPNLPGPPSEMDGVFRVIGNTVRRARDLEYGKADSGIVLQRAAMTAHIEHNMVSSFGFSGIAIDANQGDVTVKANTIARCGYGDKNGAGFPQSCGIGIRGTSGSFAVTVQDNILDCGPAAGTAVPCISKNGIALLGASRVSVRGNTLTGTVSSVGILVTRLKAQGATRNTITENTLVDLVAGHAQELIDLACDGNHSNDNTFGAIDLLAPGVAGIVVHSNGNHLINEEFHGAFPGTSATPPVPCVWLVAGTSDNHVNSLTYGQGSDPFDVCHQVQDDGTRNHVSTLEACSHANLPQIEEHERLACLRDGGTWSAATHSCTFATP